MKEKPNPRIRKYDTTSKGKVDRYAAAVLGGPELYVGTYYTAYPLKGTTQEVVDTPHRWPPVKGAYEGGNIALERHEHSECGEESVTFPYNVQYSWGPSTYQGHIVKMADNTGYYGETPAWVYDDEATMQLQVINQAYAKAYGSKATLLVTAAEIDKTVSMVKKPFGQARNLLGQMTRRYRSLVKRGVDVSQAASKAWLEYRMGWKPVLYDLESIANAVRQQLTKTDFEYDHTYRSSITQQWAGSGEKSGSGFGSTLLGWTVNLNSKHSAGVIVRENLFSEESQPWQRIFGMQLHDVAPALWELTPYSFVVDRFLDVQTWLEAIQPRPNTKVMFSWQTTTRRSLETVSINDLWILLAGVTRHNPTSLPGSTQTLTATSLRRAVGVVPSYAPVLNTRALNLSQHADHAALLIGQLVELFPEVKNRNFGRTLKRNFSYKVMK